MSRLHVRITGVVQGVGFRWFVREKARRLGLSGWVRNLADGSVEVIAEGDDGQVALLEAELRRGPEGSSVDALTPLAGTPDQPLVSPFGIIKG